jgi:hypothetical protein
MFCEHFHVQFLHIPKPKFDKEACLTDLNFFEAHIQKP